MVYQLIAWWIFPWRTVSHNQMVKIPLIPLIHQIHQILVQRCRPCRLMLAEHIGIDSLKRWGPRVDAPPVDGLWMIRCASKWNQNRDKIATATTLAFRNCCYIGWFRNDSEIMETSACCFLAHFLNRDTSGGKAMQGMPLDSRAPVTQETVCP